MLTVEIKRCPQCGKKMIRRYRPYVLCSYPSLHPWDWWCGCGYSEVGGVERSMTLEEMVRREWEGANAVVVGDGP